MFCPTRHKVNETGQMEIVKTGATLQGREQISAVVEKGRVTLTRLIDFCTVCS